jgi:hypothetical protein
MLAVDAILVADATYGIVHAMAILRASDAAPYRPGTYLFPACVVDAREPIFRVHAVGDAQSVDVVTRPTPGLSLAMRDGGRLLVPAGSVEEAQRAGAALETVREALARALAEDDVHALAELDPLHDRAMSSPIGPTESMRPLRTPWIRLDWAIAGVVGVSARRATRSATTRCIARSSGRGRSRRISSISRRKGGTPTR